MDSRKHIFYAKNVAQLALGTVGANLIQLITLPLLSRLFTEKDFGDFAIFHAIAAMGLSISSLRMELALVGSSDVNWKNRLVFSLFWLNFGLAILILMITEGWMYFSVSALGFNLIWLFLFFATSANSLVLESLLNSTDNYKMISAGKMVLSISFAVIAFIAAYFSIWQGLIIAAAISASIQFLFLIGASIRLGLSLVSGIKPIEMCRQNRPYILYSSPASLLDAMASKMVVIGLAYFFSAELTGAWFMAERIVLIPLAILGGVVSKIVFKEFTDKQAAGHLYASDFYLLWRIMALIGILPMLAMVFWGKDIIPYFLGADWEKAGEIAAIVSIWGFTAFVSSATSSGFIVIGKQQLTPVFNLFRIFSIIVLFAISSWTNNFYHFCYGYVALELLRSLTRNLSLIHLVKKQSLS